ncbi:MULTISPECIES: GntR family transcriptional regulator [Alteribacter]|uniref:GntR family transcriptional regulator n=1 Tax=Alteribacter keqinensis TaxID=2483800 RepID=A0A3M7TSP1_9BACI|nr:MULTISPECIES: GntR family transcriptional regulator [Alteribacter]MBM7097407.1 GntR family transcriptional regulator [Alteribacter salitolerans]RNA68650.1 GntR family transcriptional regulator [Alteribacter keqinensis]
MYFNIDPKKNVPLYEQIIHQVKEMCAKGLLKPEEKLPSVRELSSQIVINPNTVSKAYKELERQGVIMTIRGRGTFISEDFHFTHDPRKSEAIKQALKQAVIDSHYVGIEKEQVESWIEEFYQEIGGENRES